MTQQVTKGVKISVETFYQPEFSNPAGREFMFAYRITIENNNSFSVQLISRQWFIFDSNGTTREVSGDGVVGEQPVINPGSSYQYSSGCNLASEAGNMHGSYLFENLAKKTTFSAVIPRFEMFVPFILN